MMPPNLRTVAISAEILCIQCSACGHRAALGKDKTNCHRGNMEPLYALKFRCEGCGKKGQQADGFDLYIPFTIEEAKDFMAGHDLEKRKIEALGR